MTDVIATIAQGIGTTLTITFASFALGAVLAVPLALMRRSRTAALRWIAAIVIESVRAIPPVVWLFVIFYIVGVELIQLDTLKAAIIGFALISAVYIAEIYRAALDAVPPGQWEAAGSLGLNARSTYLHVIVPQATFLTIAPAATFLIGLLKDSAVASIIGAVDIAYLASQTARSTGNGLAPFIVAAGFYLLLSVPIAAIARGSAHFIERRLVAP